MNEARLNLPLTEDLKANMLKISLNERQSRSFKNALESGKTYAEVWAAMDNKYRDSAGLSARGQWKALKLYNPGKLTGDDWLAYQEDFENLKADVPDATEEEAYELLIQTLPQIFVHKFLRGKQFFLGKSPFWAYLA